ncbi:MAG: TRAP transporter small permease [Moorellaceae bacterium]
MKHFTGMLDKIEAVASVVLLSVLSILVFVSALLRYLGHPINWSDTIAGVLFVWVIYIGADRAFRKDRHMGVDLLIRRLPSKVQACLSIIVLLIVLAFLLLIAYVGISLTMANTGRIIEDIPISYSLVTLSVPVGALLMCLTGFGKMIAKIRELKGKS